jgi:hypothetical protein
MLTHIHIVVYTWWCWLIYKGEEVGVETDQLGEETEAKRVIRSDWTLASEDLRVRSVGGALGLPLRHDRTLASGGDLMRSSHVRSS